MTHFTRVERKALAHHLKFESKTNCFFFKKKNSFKLTAKFFKCLSCFQHTLQLLFVVFLDLHWIGEHLKSEHLVVVKELIVGFLVVPNRFLEVISERWRFATEITTKAQFIVKSRIKIVNKENKQTNK